MNGVAFHRPRTVAEAVTLLASHEDARPLAGGASMVAMMNARLLTPGAIVSLRDISELRGITVLADGGVRIGAMTRHVETAAASELKGTLGCVPAAARRIANPPVRNMGTMGGSISLFDPAADYPPALVAAKASIEIAGPGGRRLVPAKEFFVDWYTTALQPGELVVAVVLPSAKAGTAGYQKLALVNGDFAIASIAISRTDEGEVSVAVGGCGPHPVTDERANAALSRGLTEESVREAGEILAAAADPVDDVRATASYRRLVIPRLMQRAVNELH